MSVCDPVWLPEAEGAAKTWGPDRAWLSCSSWTLPWPHRPRLVGSLMVQTQTDGNPSVSMLQPSGLLRILFLLFCRIVSGRGAASSARAIPLCTSLMPGISSSVAPTPPQGADVASYAHVGTMSHFFVLFFFFQLPTLKIKKKKNLGLWFSLPKWKLAFPWI